MRETARDTPLIFSKIKQSSQFEIRYGGCSGRTTEKILLGNFWPEKKIQQKISQMFCKQCIQSSEVSVLEQSSGFYKKKELNAKESSHDEQLDDDVRDAVSEVSEVVFTVQYQGHYNKSKSY